MPLDAVSVARALYWSQFGAMVAEYLDTGRFDPERASQALGAYAQVCLRQQVPVEIPPDFAELLALGLSGKTGRKTPAKKLSYVERRVLVRKFIAAREREGAGSYAALLNQFSKGFGVSEAYIKTLLSQENGKTPDHE